MTGAIRMTALRTLRAELLKLRRSPLVAAHVACALAAGAACGAYFAIAPWDTSFGADAYAQFLGALMPLMASIACGLSVDEERGAGRFANMLSAPSRGSAVLAKLVALWLAAAFTLATAVALFAGILSATGRLVLPLSALGLSVGGLAGGSFPLYVLSLFLSLRFGRNVAIGVGASGMLLAFFSVGGLANGLVTGALTGAAPAGVFGAVPLCWAARLGSLGVEGAIAGAFGSAEAVVAAAWELVPACAALSVATASLLAAWFASFEEGRGDA